jgi:hypothetical protein
LPWPELAAARADEVFDVGGVEADVQADLAEGDSAFGAAFRRPKLSEQVMTAQLGRCGGELGQQRVVDAVNFERRGATSWRPCRA